MSKFIEASWAAIVSNHEIRREVEVEVAWFEDDPLILVMAFLDGHSEPMWEVSRDLLLNAQVGDRGVPGADIQAAFGLRTVYLTLTGDGAPPCLVSMARGPVDTFLEETLERVPQGEEKIDVDAALEELLK